MFTADAIYRTIEARIGWNEAGRILGIPDAAEHFLKVEDWRVRDAYANLIMKSPEARRALMQFPPPDAPINPLSDSDTSYATGSAAVNAFLVDEMIGQHAAAAKDVLDFGCGTGRLLRLLAQFSPERRYSGCDVVESAVTYVKASGIPGAFATMAPTPPAPFPDQSFDVVLAWSIFSHYSEPLHLAWLKDIRRMLHPGGVLFATVHSSDSFDTQRGDPRVKDRLDFDALEAAYLKDGFSFVRSYQGYAVSGLDEENFGHAFISADYIRSQWANLFEVVSVTCAVPGWQDMVVLRRPSGCP